MAEPKPPALPEESNLERRRWRLLAVTSVGAFMAPFDGSVVSVALPSIGRALHLSFLDGIWVQAAYLLALTGALIPAGRLADARGRLSLYWAGVATFTLASLAAGLSPSGSWLLGARVVQGLGSALLAATATALVTSAFPPGERGRALGLNVMCVYLGLALGPVLGGILVQHVGWRSIFYVNLPVGAATALLGRGLRERPQAARPARMDLRGALLFAGGVCALLLGLTVGPVWGWKTAGTVGFLAAGVALLGLFLAVEARTREPMLDLELFARNRLFAAGNLAALANYVAFTAVTVLTAIFLEVVDGHPAQTAGLWLTVQPLCMTLLSPLAGRLSDRFGSRWLASGGMLAIAGGLASLAVLPPGSSPGRLWVTLAGIGAGMAAFSSPNTSAVMGSVDRSHLGVASATLGTMRFLGQSLSVALLGALASSRLGSGGQLRLFTGQSGGDLAAGYVQGYHLAMSVAALIALVGAAASLARGPGAEPVRKRAASGGAPA